MGTIHLDFSQTKTKQTIQTKTNKTKQGCIENKAINTC